MEPIQSPEQLEKALKRIYTLEAREGIDSVKLQELKLLRLAVELYRDGLRIHPIQCPFCGCGETSSDINRKRGYFIYCKDCKASGPYGDTKEEAIDIWNKRTY